MKQLEKNENGHVIRTSLKLSGGSFGIRHGPRCHANRLFTMQTPPFHELLEIYPRKDEQLDPQGLKLKDLQRDAISELICMGLMPENPKGSGLWRGGLPTACSQYFNEAILALVSTLTQNPSVCILV